MSQNYDSTNSGALFNNDRKTKDNQPGWRGSVNVEGKEFWVSAWVRVIGGGPRAGEKMISMALTPKDDKPEQTGGYTSPEPADDYDDDIPF